MSKLYFLFGIHNHQPAGNDPYVFREAFDLCYKPFLDVLKEFPQIKCNIHVSGPLYDWILENEKGYLGILKELAEKKQVEMISGGYYEPILQTIPDSDKLAQIRLMNEFIKKEFNYEPKGMWLAERIWEPYLARSISDAGLKYTFLDDTHFRKAGLGEKELFGYYLTEESSKSIAVFPISKTLRYKIPFSKAEEAIAILKSFKKKNDVLVTLFDDGEKFGLWPTTNDWVYKKEWLRRFFLLLQKNKKHIETILASEAVNRFMPNGLIYLPNSSYIEMDEWVMEPKDFFLYKDLKDCVKDRSDYDRIRHFINAGFFRNFFLKYPRLNYMHKRMLGLSEKMNKNASPEKDKDIFQSLWKSQCNCGYWHGVFGGFYFGHIRAAIYENLIEAEKKYDERYMDRFLTAERADLDLDGLNETMIKNRKMIACFSDKGATIVELSLKERNFNLLNTITRREELYHAYMKGRLKKELVYDKYERLSFMDHLVGKKMTINDFNRMRKIKTLSNEIYAYAAAERDSSVDLNYVLKNKDIEFAKRISMGTDSEVFAEYEFKNEDFTKKYDFSVEFNLFLQSSRDAMIFAKDKHFGVEEKTTLKGLSKFAIEDKFKGIRITFEFDSANVFFLPIYSMTNSIKEGGKDIEKMFQEISVLLVKKNKGDKFKIHLSVDNI